MGRGENIAYFLVLLFFFVDDLLSETVVIHFLRKVPFFYIFSAHKKSVIDNFLSLFSASTNPSVFCLCCTNISNFSNWNILWFSLQLKAKSWQRQMKRRNGIRVYIWVVWNGYTTICLSFQSMNRTKGIKMMAVLYSKTRK